MAFPPSISTKRCYNDISGQQIFSTAKCTKREFQSLEQAMKCVDTAEPAEVRSIADVLWRDGLLRIKEGEFKISLELCTYLTPDRLKKILCMTGNEIREQVTQFSLLHYLHLSTEIPAILLDAFPHLDLTELRECHTLLPDHLFYIGKTRVQITANKGVFGFNRADGSNCTTFENVSPLHFQNCLRVTVGTPPFFTKENHLHEYLQFVGTLSYLHLFDAPLRIVTLFEQALSAYLIDHKADILDSTELCAWLNELTKLLQPGFHSRKLLGVRQILVHEFYGDFCERLRANYFGEMDNSTPLDEFKKVESYLSLTSEETVLPDDHPDSPLQFIKTYLSQLLNDLIRNRLFSEEYVDDDIEFCELIEIPLIKSSLIDSINKLTSHSYRELTPTLIRNTLFLLEYAQEYCMEEIPDCDTLKNLILKQIDLLQFDVRPGDAEKALVLCKTHSDTYDEVKFLHVLLLRKTDPALSKMLLINAIESCDNQLIREGFKLLLAYSLCKDDGDIDGALEYARGCNTPLFQHLRAYILTHKNPIPYDEIEQLVSEKQYCNNPLAWYSAFILGKEMPEQEVTWITSYTLMSLFISEIASQMPYAWRLKLLSTHDLNKLFL